MAQEEFNAALPLLRNAYEMAGEPAAIACLMAQCHLGLKRFDNAEVILSAIKMADQTAHYEQLSAQLTLLKQAAKTPELAALEAAHQAAPEDLQLRYELALQLSKEHEQRAALEQLLYVLRKERTFAEGEVRKSYTAILLALGKADPLAIEFQRKLFTLLY
jgi:putative thioredoxin